MASSISKYRPMWNRRRAKVWGSIMVLGSLMLSTCDTAPPLLQQVQERGKLIVVTRNSPTVYFEDSNGPAGYEYELFKGFADHLGVDLELRLPKLFSHILPAVQTQEAHMAAAGLSVTLERQQLVRFGPPIQEITATVVYQRGQRKPRKVQDLVGSELEVVGDSSHSERLRQLQQVTPGLNWVENHEDDANELTYRVANGELQYSVADSNLIAINLRYYPLLGTAFPISPPEKIAWAFHKSADLSLVNEAEAYFAKLKQSGELTRLQEQYYGHVKRLDNPGAARFAKQISKNLGKYEALFKKAAKQSNFDWRLLAAVGYQESHWNPKAKSPTGVRGIMMLTRITAKELGVKNRLDPEQSIMGGARYLRNLYDRIPRDVTEPDRTWMMLAAYNVGMGHLYDARTFTKEQGDNRSLWVDVRERLPLLNQKKWYSQAKRGFARGREAVEYVENIRSYYDVLVWHTSRLEDEPNKEEDDEIFDDEYEDEDPIPDTTPSTL
ncbi:MAG: membrane-bound lytic murein transglycosylase MltF [Gammaproteobacteria bacterium]|nr:membrane-bound lytic murein transglycosylase MltF [Gammaproteobacteria bacterium]